jgi:hypothetical protein
MQQDKYVINVSFTRSLSEDTSCGGVGETGSDPLPIRLAKQLATELQSAIDATGEPVGEFNIEYVRLPGEASVTPILKSQLKEESNECE